MRLYTSRYANPDLAHSDELVKVGITLYPPRWKLPYRVAAYARELAPDRSIFGIEDPDTFELLFRAKLDGIGADRILARLSTISKTNGGRSLVLLCYEDLTQPGQWCHRQIVANWLTKHGAPTEELDLSVGQLRLL